MNSLSKKEKIDLIISKSEELGITSNQYAENIEISNMTAYNILKGRSENPRTACLEGSNNNFINN